MTHVLCIAEKCIKDEVHRQNNPASMLKYEAEHT